MQYYDYELAALGTRMRTGNVYRTWTDKTEGTTVDIKSRRKHGFHLMTALYFIIIICMCVTRFNIIMTIIGGPITHIDAVNLLPFHGIRENLEYGRKPISWDMLDNMVMFVPIGIIYCYYQKNFSVYKAMALSFSTTLLIECAQFVLKTGVVDIDDLIINTLGGLIGILLYAILRELSKRMKNTEIHEIINIIATMLPPIFIAFVIEMFMGNGSPKFFPIYIGMVLCYGLFVYAFLIKDFTWKAKINYFIFYVAAFCLSRVIL